MSFRREAFVPKGGPDGGDGGKGGDVIIAADASLHTLLDCQYQQLYRAKNGSHGMGSNRSGKSAPDLIIRVPAGTIIKDDANGEIVADLDTPEASILVAKGGRGGKGNAHFATSRNRAPRRYEGGEPGQERRLLLELKLIADVGLVGLPNAGKSTLISKISNARPKIADYPFTTKVPGLGVVRTKAGSFVVADIPGLIEDAHKGAGMGDRFLRHIERTRLLLHLIDPSPEIEPSAEDRFKIIMKELASYSKDLVNTPMLVVINKTDVPGNDVLAQQLRTTLENQGFSVFEISALTGTGIPALLDEITELL
jgi:GTP-binding protein